MNTREVQTHLRSLGWDNVTVDGDYGPATRLAVTNFQRGFSFWNLTVDGNAGPLTQKALAYSKRKGGRCSPNFRFVEFRCKGPAISSCERIKVHRELVRSLERYRTAKGSGVTITSGYRCWTHNKSVGGATSSQHLDGTGVDFDDEMTVPKLQPLRIFAGMGKDKSGRVRHGDRRDVGRNTTGASLARPTIWQY